MTGNFPHCMPSAEPFFIPGGDTGCLLVHGFTGTPKEMRWLGEYLADQGHSVLGVRLFGHATEPEDMLRARWRDWLYSIEDGWHLLAGSTKRIFVLGLSMGGMLTLKFAAHYPVAGLVVMASPYELPKDPRLRFIKFLSLFQPFQTKGESNWYDRLGEETHVSYPVNPTRAFVEVRDLIVAMQSAIPQITAPTQLIYSRDDQTVLAKDQHMEKILSRLGSQDKQGQYIDGSSHVITRDAQRQQVFKVAADFIERIGRENKPGAV